MGKWADLAKAAGEEEPRANSVISAVRSVPDDTGTALSPPARVPDMPHLNDAAARTVLRDWHGKLSRLDVFSPPDGFMAERWADLVDDACWLYETHASQLVREGWSALDAYGVSLRRPGGEVLLDRLQGARNLRLDREGRAYWSRHGVTFITSRGAAPTGMLTIWEIGNAG